jgi:molecular chaperone DnaK
MKEHGDKVDAGTRGTIEQAVNRLKDAQKSDDAQVIERAIQEVTEASHKLGEAVYKAAGAKAAAGGAAPDAGMPGGGAPGGESAGDAKSSGKKDDDVIDAEFEVKK